MSQFSVIALFCEDVRQELSGQETIVGVLPDNISVNSIPSMMPKFSVYIRCNFSREFNLKTLTFKMISPDGTVLFENPVEKSVIQQTLIDGQQNDSILVSIKSFASFNPFPILLEGQYKVISLVNDKEYISGVVRFGVTP